MSSFKTVCSKCVFNEGSKFVDCILDRYEKFEARGEVNEEGVIDRLCVACRNEDWLDRSNEEKVGRITKELANVYSLLIYDDEKAPLTRLEATLSVKQTLPPKQVIFVYNDTTSLNDVNNFLIKYYPSPTVVFTIKQPPDTPLREMIDFAFTKCNGMFYTLIKNGETLPENCLERLHNKIEGELEKIIWVKPFGESMTGSTINCQFHKVVNGNFAKDIEEKLEEIDDKLDYYREWKDL